MFPSTGHFKSLHCPFHLEDNCGRIYCHFRHVKNADEKSVENTVLSKLETQICSDLKIDKTVFDLEVNEEDDTVHEKLLNKRLKIRFPDCDALIDNFRFPESSSKDSFEFTTGNSSTEKNVHDLINLTDDDTPLDEGPLKQFLEEDAKQNQSAEHKNRNTIEKRHIIISCLEKIDKREFNPRRVGVVQPRKFASISEEASRLNEVENTDDVCTQPLNDKSLLDDVSQKLKQEDDASESSESEDNAEVDKILTQMELLDPQLFNIDVSGREGLKQEPVDVDDEDTKLNLASQVTLVNDLDLSSQNTAPYSSLNAAALPAAVPKENRVGRINLKSIQAINNEVSNNGHISSVRVKRERPYEPMFASAITTPLADPIITAATIAEQNRLKNVFKNTICSSIDQFFDLSDACKVYGTEIFNLLEPLLNYLIEKLNPEFNFEKLRQLHSQNISLACGLPFVSSCDHVKNCIECHNILLSAMARCNIRRFEKATETSSGLASSGNDTPLRKIEAGLHDITKEMLSLGIPVDETPAVDKPASGAADKTAKCQTESSRREHRSGDRKHSSDKSRHRSKSESKSSRDKKDGADNRKRSSSRKHSRSEHHSSRSSSGRKHEKRRKEGDSDESKDEEAEKWSRREHRSAKSSSHGAEKRRKGNDSSESDDDERERGSSKKQPRLSRSGEHKRKKRPSSDKDGSESKKQRVEVTRAKTSPEMTKRRNAKDENLSDKSDSDSDRSNDGGQLSDGYSDLETEDNRFDAEEKNDADSTDASDSENEDEEKRNAKNSADFVDLYPQTASKKRVSHVSEGSSSSIYRKPIVPKKHIPTPTEALHQRMQNRKVEASSDKSISNWLGNTNEKVRISHVPNVALLLKAKERIKNDLLQKPLTSITRITVPQTTPKGQSRIAHMAPEQPKPKDIPTHASTVRPVINSYKTSHNIPGPTRQNGLDRLYNAFVKKVPPELAGELALKEEKQIHEKVTITKIYLNSLAMALHRISKEDPAKLVEKTNEYPVEVNGISIYDIVNKHLLTYEQLEINGFPLPVPSMPGCCCISTKAVHYKPLASKRSGDRFYCQQCKELFDVCPETGMPITPSTGCRFHQFRPRKEPGRLRHELYYPCCNKGISESGCVTAEHHTPDTTDDDCLEGFIETRDAPPGERGSKQIYSLDCEMCYTTVGAELTRVTVIGYDCNTVYDSLVKPRNRILDYCTKFSGITEEKLRRVTKTIEQVRQELFKFVFKDTILIGHSLENDLKALKIFHYKIVDTSVMYPHRDAPERKFSLKYLASNMVHFLIQESEHGHDSKEDALACMKLVWKKIKEDAQVHRPRKIIGSPKRNS